MRLSKLLKGVKKAELHCDGEDGEREISGLFIDSREAQRGGLYICLTGGERDGHLFALQAVSNGAVALVVERVLPISVPQIVVPDTREAMSYLAATFYQNPAKDLHIIGITGTNGKTTTSHLLAAILRRAGKRVGIIGTLGVFYGKKHIPSPLTTPDPLFLQKVYAEMVACGVEYVVQEVSAHALHYKKDAGIEYAACIFTNLTQDHLDFFQDMQAYKEAKLGLFSMEKCSLAVINADDNCAEEILSLRENQGVFTYGLTTPADCFAVLTNEGALSQQFVLNLSDDLCRVTLKMTGRHNIYNALAAASCAYKLGVGVGAIAAGLSEAGQIEGRLQLVAEYHGGWVFVDFAHTPDGLENCLKALKKHTKGRLICVFGCGGNRDKTKRPLMGKVAAMWADFCVLTADNPRYEDPLDILADIKKGYAEHSRAYVVVADRERAIEYAMDSLQEGDVLLIAGKGGEDTQEIMGIKHPFKDQDVVRKIISQKDTF